MVTVDYRKFKEVKEILEKLKECGLFEEVTLVELNSATGEVVIDLVCSDELYNDSTDTTEYNNTKTTTGTLKDNLTLLNIDLANFKNTDNYLPIKKDETIGLNE